MSLPYECVPCFMKMVVSLARKHFGEGEQANRLIHIGLDLMHQFDAPGIESAPQIAAKLFPALAKELGGIDPYKDEKKRANELLLRALPQLRSYIEGAANPLHAALRLAVVGNIIDFGAIPDLDLDAVANRVLSMAEAPLARDERDKLVHAITNANSILYIADNAGELVLDLLTIEQMPQEKVVVAVRPAPILNDATLEDAQMVGLDRIVRVIPTGSYLPGVDLSDVSQEFLDLFNSADVVIAKGQGNFETLYKTLTRPVFFLMRVKCEVIAKAANAKVGDEMIFEHKPS